MPTTRHTITGALLDRLTHHVHILELNGESYPLKQSKARRRRGLDPPMRSPQPPIPNPAKSSAPPESHVRPGYEKEGHARSAGEAAADSLIKVEGAIASATDNDGLALSRPSTRRQGLAMGGVETPLVTPLEWRVARGSPDLTPSRTFRQFTKGH